MTFRNSSGLTLPFALLLCLIFSSLVGVSYSFVSINLSQLTGSLRNVQAISLAEGINEKVKARLNTKTLLMLTPDEEAKLTYGEDDFEEDDDLFEEDDFNEDTELFSEYYADEVVKISRFVTFHNPPPAIEEDDLLIADTPLLEGEEELEDDSQLPEANVATIGNIDIPEGTVLSQGLMIVIYNGEKA